MVSIATRTPDPQSVANLMADKVPSVLARAWASRGMKKLSDVYGKIEDIIPYTELGDCEKMATILATAIQEGKRLLIVADYDADGATACSIGMRGLLGMGANVGFIIPDRKAHGYGLSEAIARIACSQTPRPDYLITVDNGIASHGGIDVCNELGIPVLVTDHHLPGETHPNAMVLVNPNKHGCTFPSKALAGCGVIFYVMWALQDELVMRGWEGFQPGFEVNNLLPIVSVGTIADLVALDQNNRILVNAGMRRIRHRPTFPGIEALSQVSKKNPRKLTTTDIAFGLGPRINAVGRLEHMEQGVDCLLCEDVEEAVRFAAKLDDVNGQRKGIEAEMTLDAAQELAAEQEEGLRTAVVHHPDWHQGVIGIVAGRVKELVWRPTFALADGTDGEHKGSGRSIPGFHLRDALDIVDRRHPGLMLKFGGHAMAAGLTLRPGGIEEFRGAFEEVGKEFITENMMNQVLETDGGMDASEMTLNNVDVLSRQVWGQGFPEPSFVDDFDILECREIGGGKHLKLKLGKQGKSFDAVKFRHEAGVITGRIRAVYKLSSNEYRGETTLQLLIDHFEAI